ncbi:MAG: FimB/Mfa2 family fimbrial subunit [Alistipes sp.]|nr:FimB/Mfa2 family fimbrial subunit [Alistipes sp.]
MNMRKTYTALRLLLLLAILPAVTSCLKENDDDCFDEVSKVRIIVRTIAEETRADALGRIDNVVIYIFDEQQRYVGSWQGDAYTYGQTYVAEFDIEPGTYHFVAWTNQGQIYDKTIPTYGKDDPAEALVISMKYPEDGKITDDIDDLHHGMFTDAQVIEAADNEFTVILRPNTYKLNFTVEGIPPGDDQYTFTVTDNFLQFAFDNSVIELEENTIEYIRTAGFTDENIYSSMTVLKIMDGRTPWFDFSDSTAGESLFGDDLVDMIKKAYAANGRTVDFEREFEFDIKLSFRGILGVTVSVNGWKYNPNEGNIG